VGRDSLHSSRPRLGLWRWYSKSSVSFEGANRLRSLAGVVVGWWTFGVVKSRYFISALKKPVQLCRQRIRLAVDFASAACSHLWTPGVYAPIAMLLKTWILRVSPCLLQFRFCVSLFSGTSRRVGETIERPQASQGTAGIGQITHVLRRIRFSDADARLDFWPRGCPSSFYVCFVEMSYASSLISIPAGPACGCLRELEGHSRDAWRRVAVDREVLDHPCSGNSCEQ